MLLWAHICPVVVNVSKFGTKVDSKINYIDFSGQKSTVKDTFLDITP